MAESFSVFISTITQRLSNCCGSINCCKVKETNIDEGEKEINKENENNIINDIDKDKDKEEKKNKEEKKVIMEEGTKIAKKNEVINEKNKDKKEEKEINKENEKKDNESESINKNIEEEKENKEDDKENKNVINYLNYINKIGNGNNGSNQNPKIEITDDFLNNMKTIKLNINKVTNKKLNNVNEEIKSKDKNKKEEIKTNIKKDENKKVDNKENIDENEQISEEQYDKILDNLTPEFKNMAKLKLQSQEDNNNKDGKKAITNKDNNNETNNINNIENKKKQNILMLDTNTNNYLNYINKIGNGNNVLNQNPKIEITDDFFNNIKTIKLNINNNTGTIIDDKNEKSKKLNNNSKEKKIKSKNIDKNINANKIKEKSNPTNTKSSKDEFHKGNNKNNKQKKSNDGKNSSNDSKTSKHSNTKTNFLKNSKKIVINNINNIYNEEEEEKHINNNNNNSKNKENNDVEKCKKVVECLKLVVVRLCQSADEEAGRLKETWCCGQKRKGTSKIFTKLAEDDNLNKMLIGYFKLDSAINPKPNQHILYNIEQFSKKCSLENLSEIIYMAKENDTNVQDAIKTTIEVVNLIFEAAKQHFKNNRDSSYAHTLLCNTIKWMLQMEKYGIITVKYNNSVTAKDLQEIANVEESEKKTLKDKLKETIPKLKFKNIFTLEMDSDKMNQASTFDLDLLHNVKYKKGSNIANSSFSSGD